MRKRTFLYCLLPAVAGLALIVVAVLLSSASPGGRVVASAQARETNGCQLQVDKEGQRGVDIPFQSETRGSAGQVGEDNEIEFTIAVTSVGQVTCGSGSNEVVDQLPEGLTCEDAGVVSDPAHSFIGVEGCGKQPGATEGNGGEQVSFILAELAPGEEVVLALVARDNTDEDCVTNKACAEEGFDSPLVNGTCDQTTVCRRHPRTPTTPTPTVTNTPIPPTSTPFVPPPPPTAKPLATIVAPPTGSGANGGSSPWLALGLGLGGVCLLVVSGAALARKRIR